ncbi:MAG: dephospho-CoA kinase [Rhodospirillales bacterium]|nr:dephospho-CoA kinase [Rhodospirillales bacterium]
MLIVGLTGSIGMGKTAAAGNFRRLGVPVHDSDRAVHATLRRGGPETRAIGQAFPGVVRGGLVDRAELGKQVFGDPAALSKLERILHPAVRKSQRRFLERAARRRAPLVVLDIPLLFETGGDAVCDAVITVSAPAFLQGKRVLSRPGMTRSRLQSILKRQLPDPEKRRRSDFVVQTGLGRAHSLRAIRNIVKVLRRIRGRKWLPSLSLKGR